MSASAVAPGTVSILTAEELAAVKADLVALYKEVPCMPIAVRLAWHDAGTYCKDSKTGGANGSVRFMELKHAANAGLDWAVEKFKEVHAKHPKMTTADFQQQASVVGIEFCGGPSIPFRCGRADASEAQCVEEGRLPDATKKSDHLRDVFYRMGFNDQEIVALSGAHTLGRAHKDRSGFDGPWTEKPYVFDNEYFKNLLAPKDGCLVLESDRTLAEDPSMRPWVEKQAADNDLFLADYVKAHQKLSELGMPAAA